MVFIEGVGYVNDSSAVATPNHTQSVSETTANFDGMLRTETDKLNQASVTTNLDSIFKEAADKYGVSERLLKAIAYTESGFQADVTSFSGAMGIMQLMPSTASAYGVSDPYDAYQNIMGGAAVLKDLLNMFQGNQSLAIAGYNAGCGNVKKYGGVPPFTETQNYVAKVTSLMQTGVSVPANTVTVNPSANTSSSSFNKSLTFSIPTDILNTQSVIPFCLRICSGTSACVCVIGYVISVSTPPRLSAYLIILTFSRILIAYSFFVSSNVSIAPNPLACFFMISYPGCSLNPG